MQNAKPACSPILESSVKQDIESGKECRISGKRERCTEGLVKRLEDSQNLKTTLDWSIILGWKIGKRQWKWKQNTRFY